MSEDFSTFHTVFDTALITVTFFKTKTTFIRYQYLDKNVFIPSSLYTRAFQLISG